MDVAATIFSTGWASGVNSYATVLFSACSGARRRRSAAGVSSRTGSCSSPAGMFTVEFFTDKIPLLDSAWDSIHTVIRPLIGAILGFQFARRERRRRHRGGAGAGGSGLTALASHGVKAGLRLGVNTSPEPASNIFVSLAEDGVVAVVVLFAIKNPELAAADRRRLPDRRRRCDAAALEAGDPPGWVRLRRHDGTRLGSRLPSSQ